MNFKHFLILALFAVVVLNTVSAADNATCDNLTDTAPADINVTYDEQMWEENLSDINVELPESAEGNFTVMIDDEVIYNQTITDKSFKVPIKLPKTRELYIAIFPPIDYKAYKVSAFYNGVDLNLTTPLKIMKYSPEYNHLYFPEEILQGEKYSSLLAFPRSANGMVELYIDDKLYNRTTAMPTLYLQENPFSKLALGNHTFKVKYYGDSYYRPYNKTFNFLVTNVVIYIPEVINIGHDDCISVETSINRQGNVKVYIDGKLIANSNTDDGQYLLSLEKYIKYTNREIKIVYTSKGLSRTKIQPLNMTYNLEVWTDNFIYGNNNILELYLPDTLNNKLLKTTINGKEYQFKRSSTENNMLELDISKFEAGTYTLFLSYPDDGKFYRLNKTCNFTISYSAHIPEFFHYGSQAKVFLKLPQNATGDLVVYVDGKYFGSKKFSKGYSEVKIGSIGLGRHNVLVQYVGDDYNVSNESMNVYVSPAVSFDYEFTAGEDKYITVRVPKESKGYIIFEIDGKQHKVYVKDGMAKYSLKKLKVGYHEIYVDYYGEDGFKDMYNWVEVSVKKPKLKTLSAQATFKGVNLKFKLLTKNGKPLALKKAVIKFNGKKYNVKTNKKGIITFKKSLKLNSRKCTVKIYYMGATFTKKLKVNPLALKASATKKKITVKVSINKKVKDKKVVVKLNSKKYKVKTNKKGVAKITVKKSAFKKAKKVICSATYLKSTVKQSLKI